MLTQVLRITGALALSVVGILAANPSKNHQPIVPFATSPPATEQNVIDVLTVMHHGVVDYSQLGVNHATDPTVKEFAQMMVRTMARCSSPCRRSRPSSTSRHR